METCRIKRAPEEGKTTTCLWQTYTRYMHKKDYHAWRSEGPHAQSVLEAALDALEFPDEAARALLPVPGLPGRARFGVAAQLAVHARHLARHGHHHLQPAGCLVPPEIGRDADGYDCLPI